MFMYEVGLFALLCPTFLRLKGRGWMRRSYWKSPTVAGVPVSDAQLSVVILS